LFVPCARVAPETFDERVAVEGSASKKAIRHHVGTMHESQRRERFLPEHRGVETFV